MGLADTLKKKRETAKAQSPLAAKLAAKKAEPAPKPVSGLAATLASKKAKKGSSGGLAGMRARRDAAKKASSKLDFSRGGIRFHNATISGELTAGFKSGMGRYWGTVDVSNGDKTFTLHNRWGSWMADIGERMAEPALVAHLLGTSVSQLSMYQGIAKRFEAELKERGLTTPTERRRLLEEEAKAQRARLAKLESQRAARKEQKEAK